MFNQAFEVEELYVLITHTTPTDTSTTTPIDGPIMYQMFMNDLVEFELFSNDTVVFVETVTFKVVSIDAVSLVGLVVSNKFEVDVVLKTVVSLKETLSAVLVVYIDAVLAVSRFGVDVSTGLLVLELTVVSFVIELIVVSVTEVSVVETSHPEKEIDTSSHVQLYTSSQPSYARLVVFSIQS